MNYTALLLLCCALLAARLAGGSPVPDSGEAEVESASGSPVTAKPTLDVAATNEPPAPVEAVTTSTAISIIELIETSIKTTTPPAAVVVVEEDETTSTTSAAVSVVDEEDRTPPAPTTVAAERDIPTSAAPTVAVNVTAVDESGEVTEGPVPPPAQSEITLNATADGNTNITLSSDAVTNRLSEQIRKILKHYQKPDPIGFPGAPVPDPLAIPPMKKNFGLADMTFSNMTVHGLSKFTVERVNTDLDHLQVYVLLKMRRLYVLGNYTMKTFFSRPAAGPFNVTLIDVDADLAAELEPDADGNLQTNETQMDMQFADCELDFKNLGFMASMFQGVISSVASVLFDGIKPFIINEMNTNMKADINAQIKAITSKLPRMKMPVTDLAVVEGRKYVRRMGYDPYRLADRKIKEGPFSFTLSELNVYGLSDFRRLGEIGVGVRGRVLQLTLHVITGAVHGSMRWAYELDLSKKFGRSGATNFTVDHIQVRAMVNQSLDIRQKPVLHKLDIEVGKVAVQMDRQAPLDYIVEIAVNSLPALLRHVIVDALEEPIKQRVQTILDEVELERMVEERLPELDNMTGTELQR
ncbi:uncharacterized protein LOC126840567 [Adelges cooleyi]|uniref:uncharacterized protein LOC126840567 n=1 Tax=Adelges cooleyi TaxID=133065 RepID=UPI00217F3DEB|nr:uncharacterized protein LOC126840567 [Adelges cooleyi]